MNTEYTNELIHERSPYLLQHAHNPVHWYPWGKKAFDKAKKEDKPIFLSIGYSTCHWCHVMERESFENLEVAELLNQHFIAIKVDREERPDIDTVYMSVCQAITGQGGWPLSIFMTPEQKPFFAATYLPQNNMLYLLPEIAKQWNHNRTDLLQAGNTVVNFLQQIETKMQSIEPISQTAILKAATQLKNNFDSNNGGFGRAPKFPTPHQLSFLLLYGKLKKDDSVLPMVEKTLQQMYRGGIFDHIGGGFSRYSTDDKWLVPHFEKMLYDNALLIISYLECYQITHNSFYKMVAEKTLTYVLHELKDKTGGFYCGQDADSDGIEGKYYTFTPEEVIAQLGLKKGSYFNNWFSITTKGNFEGKNIPNLLQNEQYAIKNEYIDQLNKIIYEYRKQRATLHKDDKILTSWNALMIMALCKAYQILQQPIYLEHAKNCMQFLLQYMVDDNNHLKVSFRNNNIGEDGKIDDYAFIISALLSLYESCFDFSYLQKAEQIANKMITLFMDENNGGFYIYANNAEKLISRPKETYDGAVPSGNSVATMALLKLYQQTEKETLKKTLEKQMQFISTSSKNYPAGLSYGLMALTLFLSPQQQLIITAPQLDNIPSILFALQQYYCPNLVLSIKTAENQQELEHTNPIFQNYTIQEKPCFYLCKGHTCSAPTQSLDNILQKISEV